MVRKRKIGKSQEIKFQAIKFSDSEKIRNLRNSQINILRQDKKLSKIDQIKYFKEVVMPDLQSKTPRNILFTIKYKKNFIGYCGLTNINWEIGSAEISFLVKKKYNKSKLFNRFFNETLNYLENISHKNKIYQINSEIYDFRKEILNCFDQRNYKLAGYFRNYRIKNNVKISSFFYTKIIDKSLSKKNVNILVTSSSNKIPLLNILKDTLGKYFANAKIFVSDRSKFVTSKFYIKNSITLLELNDKNKFKIFKILNKKNINFILPTRENELYFWAKNKNFFKQRGINILITNLKTVELCNDKLKFNKFLEKNSFPNLKTYKFNGIVKKNFLIKDRFGAGSVISMINNKKLDNNKYIIQEKIKGKEISVDCWSSENNNRISTLMRERNKIKNGESEISIFFKNKKIENQIIKIIKKLKISGIFNIQGFILKNKFYIFDINPRVGGSMAFSYFKGLNFIMLSLSEHLNLKKLNFKLKKNKNNIFYKSNKVYSLGDNSF